MGRSLVQSSPTNCGVSACDRRTSYRRSKPTRAVSHKKCYHFCLYVLWLYCLLTAMSCANTNMENCGWCLQNCTKVLQALKNGEFGSCPEQFAEYKAHCHVQFPYAQVFRPPSTSCQSSPTTESNHISDGKENCVSNWYWLSTPRWWPPHQHYHFANMHSSAHVGDTDL